MIFSIQVSSKLLIESRVNNIPALQSTAGTASVKTRGDCHIDLVRIEWFDCDYVPVLSDWLSRWLLIETGWSDVVVGFVCSYLGDIVVDDRLGRWVRLSDTALVSRSLQQQMTLVWSHVSHFSRDWLLAKIGLWTSFIHLILLCAPSAFANGSYAVVVVSMLFRNGFTHFGFGSAHFHRVSESLIWLPLKRSAVI